MRPHNWLLTIHSDPQIFYKTLPEQLNPEVQWEVAFSEYPEPSNYQKVKVRDAKILIWNFARTPKIAIQKLVISVEEAMNTLLQ